MHVHIHVCAYAHIYRHIYVYIHLHMNMCIYMYLHIYIYRHQTRSTLRYQPKMHALSQTQTQSQTQTHRHLDTQKHSTHTSPKCKRCRALNVFQTWADPVYFHTPYYQILWNPHISRTRADSDGSDLKNIRYIHEVSFAKEPPILMALFCHDSPLTCSGNVWHGVATSSRLLQIIGRFCKRAL